MLPQDSVYIYIYISSTNQTIFIFTSHIKTRQHNANSHICWFEHMLIYWDIVLGIDWVTLRQAAFRVNASLGHLSSTWAVPSFHLRRHQPHTFVVKWHCKWLTSHDYWYHTTDLLSLMRSHKAPLTVYSYCIKWFVKYIEFGIQVLWCFPTFNFIVLNDPLNKGLHEFNFQLMLMILFMSTS